MAMTLNLIGDIAGRFDELMLLLNSMPKADLTVFLGDLPDRGKKSKQVIEYAMNTPGIESIKGNHDQMMIDGVTHKYLDIWYSNGGYQTVESYGGDISLIPKEHIEWLDSRPLFIQFENLIISHAPITAIHMLPKDPYSKKFDDIGLHDNAFIWNRYTPKRPLKGRMFHIHGHNGMYKEYKFGNGHIYGICLDNSRKGDLKGIHWRGLDDYEVFTQEYIT